MDCCMPSNNSKNKEHVEHNKGEQDNIQKMVLFGIIVILVIALGYLAFFKGKATGAVVQNTGGGESYEQMMSRMHPEQVQQTSNSRLANIPSMVGGC